MITNRRGLQEFWNLGEESAEGEKEPATYLEDLAAVTVEKN